MRRGYGIALRNRLKEMVLRTFPAFARFGTGRGENRSHIVSVIGWKE